MIRFQLIGETPAKKNVNKFNTKTRHVYKDAHFQKWHSDAMMQILPQKQICNIGTAISSPVVISIDFYHGDYIRRDSDNQLASIMDLLKDANILADDNWYIARQQHVRNFYEKNNARCVIEIELYRD